MIPRIVFVHGIGGPRHADMDNASWTAALAEGGGRAGHSTFAEQQLLDGGAVETVFVCYEDLFRAPHAQGDSVLSEEDSSVVLELLADFIDDNLETSDDPEARAVLSHARAELRASGIPQGAGALVRTAINVATTLLSAGPLARAGQWLTARLMIRDLAQVVRYLNRAEADQDGLTLDQRIRARLREGIGDKPAVVVAHSLGSVVALETLHEYAVRIPLLVTLGSPLSMRTVVWSKVRPAPPRTPEGVDSWLNFWDRDDIFVSRPKLETAVQANTRGILPRSRRIDSDGLWVHTATKYLAKADVGGPIAAAAKELFEA